VQSEGCNGEYVRRCSRERGTEIKNRAGSAQVSVSESQNCCCSYLYVNTFKFPAAQKPHALVGKYKRLGLTVKVFDN
jgi:hypothetical protein